MTSHYKHSPSEEKFFANWDHWLSAIEIADYETLDIHFVWVTEQRSSTEERPETMLKRTCKKSYIRLAYTAHVFNMEVLDLAVWEKLQRIKDI